MLALSTLGASPSALSQAVPPNGRPLGAHPMSFALLAERAKNLASSPFEPLPLPARAWVEALDYDEAREIRFEPEHALPLREGRFDLRLFHLGYVQRQPVQIYVRAPEGDGYLHLPFHRDWFDYGSTPRPPEDADLMYAGFRIHYPLNRWDIQDELLVFQGASYFRALGRGHRYGLSARGLAVDPAVPGKSEEFPAFVAFWIAAQDEHTLEVLALLDGASLTGAYQFLVRPGEVTRMDITARLFPRREVEQLGLAPLTSMYLHSEHQPGPATDHRPEVHDSDGLVVDYPSGERIYRPLRNPGSTAVSSFLAKDGVLGFGLVQRDRSFEHYQDLETRQDLRPTAWVEPKSGFGAGAVVLLELATELETDDNAVAFFVPKRPAPGGSPPLSLSEEEPGRTDAPPTPLEVEYALEWRDFAPSRPLARVVGTRRDRREGRDRFIIDFAPPVGRPIECAELTPSLSASEGGQIREPIFVKNPVTDGFRLMFDAARDTPEDIELRAHLAGKDRRCSEIWNYRWAADKDP